MKECGPARSAGPQNPHFLFRRLVVQPFFAASLRLRVLRPVVLVLLLRLEVLLLLRLEVLLLPRVLAPPMRPPFREEDLFSVLPRPLPDFFPPPLVLFTVAHARDSASLVPTPRFLYPSSIFSAVRFWRLVYLLLLPLGMVFTPACFACLA